MARRLLGWAVGAVKSVAGSGRYNSGTELSIQPTDKTKRHYVFFAISVQILL